MIWLASFPRSGNTYIRNILHDVYGLTSSEYHISEHLPFEKNYLDHPLVKTHLLPWEIVPETPDIKAVYLVRDGRDSVVSMAHQRSDIIAPGSDFYQNLKEAILAAEGSHFGGWSTNVNEWTRRCDLIIRYEDLVKDPLGQAERLRQIIELPEARPENLLSFEEAKKGKAAYGSRKEWGYSKEEAEKLASKIFRKGISGSWKTDMPDDLHELFWTMHGDTMHKFGYTRDGSIGEPDTELDHVVRKKLGMPSSKNGGKVNKILIEADKLATNDNDGVKRYVSSIVDGLSAVCNNENSRWDIDLLIKRSIVPLENYCKQTEKEWEAQKDERSGVREDHHPIGFFDRMERSLQSLVPRKFIEWLSRNNIRIFHVLYDSLKWLILKAFSIFKSISSHILAFVYQGVKGARIKLSERNIKDLLKGYDLIHVPLQQHYGLFKSSKTPLLFTVHDFTHKLFPEYHTKINIQNAEDGIQVIRKKKAHVLAVSNSTLNDCKRFLPLPDGHYHMVHESLEEGKFMMNFNPDKGRRVREKYGIDTTKPFILLLGTLEPRKNISNSIKAFQLFLERNDDPEINIVIAGKKGWNMDKLAEDNSSIIFTGFIDDEDLSTIYSEALVLSYISFYEGFGLPILEAMRCGTPVIYGDNSSMPEVAGKGGIPADPNDVEDICKKYEMIFFDSELRKQLSGEALKQSNIFTPRKSTLELLKVYETIIHDSN